MEFKYVVIATLLSLFIVTIPMIYIFNKIFKNTTTYNLSKRQIELEALRDHLEKSIYISNEKIASDQKRWQEINHIIFEAAQNSIKSTNNIKKQKSIPRIPLNR